ncbi:hypothetical protein BKA70DRAFT_187328 [Coprinopsis sp. MPI-PUGE-AT-0042]|nr:hypothetical protein BKA70DRAFT_187328 [Coprinopsis sp. MPI-PUGE-AT-0042]
MDNLLCHQGSDKNVVTAYPEEVTMLRDPRQDHPRTQSGRIQRPGGESLIVRHLIKGFFARENEERRLITKIETGLFDLRCPPRSSGPSRELRNCLEVMEELEREVKDGTFNDAGERALLMGIAFAKRQIMETKIGPLPVGERMKRLFGF